MAITSFTASSTSVTAGSSVDLSWVIDGADDATINHNIGYVDSISGTYTVAPQETTTYTLTADLSDGSTDTATVTVTVSNPVTGPPVITSFTASASGVASGSSVTLSWTINGADLPPLLTSQYDPTVYTPGQGLRTYQITPGTAASFTVTSLTIGTQFTLTVSNANGSATATVTVSVADISLTFSAAIRGGNDQSAVTISLGLPIQLVPHWSGSPSSVSIDNGIGTITSGSDVSISPIWPAATTTYTMTVVFSYGTFTTSATVTITTNVLTLVNSALVDFHAGDFTPGAAYETITLNHLFAGATVFLMLVYSGPHAVPHDFITLSDNMGNTYTRLASDGIVSTSTASQTSASVALYSCVLVASGTLTMTVGTGDTWPTSGGGSSQGQFTSGEAIVFQGVTSVSPTAQLNNVGLTASSNTASLTQLSGRLVTTIENVSSINYGYFSLIQYILNGDLIVDWADFYFTGSYSPTTTTHTVDGTVALTFQYGRSGIAGADSGVAYGPKEVEIRTNVVPQLLTPPVTQHNPSYVLWFDTVGVMLAIPKIYPDQPTVAPTSSDPIPTAFVKIH